MRRRWRCHSSAAIVQPSAAAAAHLMVQAHRRLVTWMVGVVMAGHRMMGHTIGVVVVAVRVMRAAHHRGGIGAGEDRAKVAGVQHGFGCFGCCCCCCFFPNSFLLDSVQLVVVVLVFRSGSVVDTLLIQRYNDRNAALVVRLCFSCSR